MRARGAPTPPRPQAFPGLPAELTPRCRPSLGARPRASPRRRQVPLLPRESRVSFLKAPGSGSQPSTVHRGFPGEWEGTAALSLPASPEPGAHAPTGPARKSCPPALGPRADPCGARSPDTRTQFRSVLPRPPVSVTGPCLGPRSQRPRCDALPPGAARSPPCRPLGLGSLSEETWTTLRAACGFSQGTCDRGPQRGGFKRGERSASRSWAPGARWAALLSPARRGPGSWPHPSAAACSHGCRWAYPLPDFPFSRGHRPRGL